MTLKNWIRFGKNKWIKIKNDKIIDSIKINYEVSMYTTRIALKFRDKIMPIYFKTKSQALRFAKNYMRKH